MLTVFWFVKYPRPLYPGADHVPRCRGCGHVRLVKGLSLNGRWESHVMTNLILPAVATNGDFEDFKVISKLR